MKPFLRRLIRLGSVGGLIGTCVGALVTVWLQSRDFWPNNSQWERFDMARDAAHWAILAADDPHARHLVKLYRDMMEACAADAEATYPCRNKLRWEPLLMSAALDPSAQTKLLDEIASGCPDCNMKELENAIACFRRDRQEFLEIDR